MTLGWSFWKFHPIRTLSPRIENRKFSILERFLIERISGPKIDFWDFLHQNVMNLDFGWFFSKNFDLSRILNFKMKFENFRPCIFGDSWSHEFSSFGPKRDFFQNRKNFNNFSRITVSTYSFWHMIYHSNVHDSNLILKLGLIGLCDFLMLWGWSIIGRGNYMNFHPSFFSMRLKDTPTISSVVTA